MRYAAGILLVSLLLCGCAREEENSYALVLSCDTPYYEEIARGFTETAESLGREAAVEAPEEMSVSEQYHLLQKLEKKKLSGLAVIPNSSTAFNDLLSEYRKDGTAVIAVESMLNTEDAALGVFACSYEKMASDLLERAAGYLDGKGQIAILSTTNQSALTEGMIKEIRDLLESGAYPELLLTEVAYGNNDEDRCRAKTEHLYQAYPDLDLVLTLSSEATKGAAGWILEAGAEEELQAAGFALPEEAEPYLGTAIPFYYTYNPENLGKAAALALEKAVQEKFVFRAGEEVELDGLGVFSVFDNTGAYLVKENSTGEYPGILLEDSVTWIESE